MHGMGNTFGVFFNSFQTEFAWSRTTISGAQSLAFFLEGLFAIAVGRLTDKFGPKLVIVTSGLILGLGYFLMSQINTAWQLYVFYGVIVGMGTTSGNVTLLSTTTRWFVKRRGIMSGIVKVGTGAGIAIMPLVASWLISSYGWRNSYAFLGIIGMISVVSFAQFLKRDPDQIGLKPYGMYEHESNNSHTPDSGLSFQEAIRTEQFWMICSAYFAAWYIALSATGQIIPHALDLGVSTVRAAGVLSIIGGVSIPGRLVMGFIGDKVSMRRALVVCFLILIVALSWLQFAKTFWELYLFAAIYGFAHGGVFALISPLVAELFGTKSHGTIFGMVLFISQIGGTIGPVTTGRIFDLTLSYQIAFLILLIASILGSVLLTLLRPVMAESEKE
jgi:MFS family permease